MNYPTSRAICESLKNVGAITSADQMSELAGRQRNYLRSQWARGKDMSLSAYTALYFNLESMYQDREQQLVSLPDNEHSEEKLQLFEFEFALKFIWALMAGQSQAILKEHAASSGLPTL